MVDADQRQITRRAADQTETVRANRIWWDRAANWYQAEHGAFLRDVGFIWCPEGLDEATVGLLGDLSGSRVLEIGCGAAQCSRWLLARPTLPVEGALEPIGLVQGPLDSGGFEVGFPRSSGGSPALVVGIDLSHAQLAHAVTLNERTGVHPYLAQADAQRLPFGDRSFDIACSAFGAIPFVADSALVMREAARVLRPGGRWVFSVSHPVRWCFPDDPGERGLVARDSYFDRRAYVEQDDTGVVTYAEHHRTMGDRVREVVAAGFELLDLVEPEWPDEHDRTWGGWSPLRGRLIPGTAIFVCQKR